MRIAILTLPFHSNYGGVLQAFALQTVLQRMGHEVAVVDKNRYRHRSWLRQQVAFGAFLVRKYVLRRNVEYVNLRRLENEQRTVEKPIRDFVDTHLYLVPVNDLLHEFPMSVDAVVVGSDQVWRPKYFTRAYGCPMDNAFLSFLHGRTIKRIAYAASFGTENWEYSNEQTHLCSRFIQLFDAVSVRESSAIRLCKERLGRGDACRMPDPTLLLSRDDYLSLCDKQNEPRRYMFYYVLDETAEIRSKAESIAKERGLVLKQVKGDVDNPHLPVRERIKAPVEEWIKSINNADFVFTDSFHGCVFSILFGIPFVVLGNSNRGLDRFNTLLSVYHLEKNYIPSIHQYDPGVDYSVPKGVELVLDIERNNAYSFLRRNLEK